MDQVDMFTYDATNGELVVIEVKPVGTNGTVTASLDGSSLQNVGSPASPRFELKVTRASGQRHTVKLEYSFVAGGDDARFETTLSGSRGGRFDGGSIYRSDALHEADYTFKVK